MLSHVVWVSVAGSYQQSALVHCPVPPRPAPVVRLLFKASPSGSQYKRRAVTSTVAVSVSVAPSSSVTRRVTVIDVGPFNPAAEKVGVMPISSP